MAETIIDNLRKALETWNEKLAEIWLLLTQSPEEFSRIGSNMFKLPRCKATGTVIQTVPALCHIKGGSGLWYGIYAENI